MVRVYSGRVCGGDTEGRWRVAGRRWRGVRDFAAHDLPAGHGEVRPALGGTGDPVLGSISGEGGPGTVGLPPDSRPRTQEGTCEEGFVGLLALTGRTGSDGEVERRGPRRGEGRCGVGPGS